LPEYRTRGIDGLHGNLQCTQTLRRRNDRRGIDEDRAYASVEVIGERENQETRLGSDRDTDLVGESEAPTSFPALLRDEDPDQVV